MSLQLEVSYSLKNNAAYTTFSPDLAHFALPIVALATVLLKKPPVKTLSCLTNRSCRGCEMLSIMLSSLWHILLSTTNFVCFLVSMFLMLLPQQMAAKKTCTCNSRKKKHAAYIKRPKLPQNISSALSFSVDSISVAFPVRFVAKVSVALHHLHHFSHNYTKITQPSPSSWPHL